MRGSFQSSSRPEGDPFWPVVFLSRWLSSAATGPFLQQGNKAFTVVALGTQFQGLHTAQYSRGKVHKYCCTPLNNPLIYYLSALEAVEKAQQVLETEILYLKKYFCLAQLFIISLESQKYR